MKKSFLSSLVFLFIFSQAHAAAITPKSNTSKMTCTITLRDAYANTNTDIQMADLSSFNGWSEKPAPTTPNIFGKAAEPAKVAEFTYSLTSLSNFELKSKSNKKVLCPDLIEGISEVGGQFMPEDKVYVVNRYQLSQTTYKYSSTAEALRKTGTATMDPESFGCFYVPVRMKLSHGEIASASCNAVTIK